jgi:hypothetical protein
VLITACAAFLISDQKSQNYHKVRNKKTDRV